MSRPSFRPRPIDLNKALPIVKSNRDLKHDEDSVTVARALPAMATGVDPIEEEERHLQQALVASIYGEDRRRALNDIPIPIVREREYDTSALPKFTPSEEYIHVNKNDEALDTITVDYEMDEVDENFIASLPQKKLTITFDEFEVAMDKLEKAQGRSMENLPYSVMKGVLTEAMPPTFPDMLKKEVYVHWVDRRTLERKGRPFLRLLQPPPDINDPNPAVAFRYRDDFAGASGRVRQARQNSYDNYKRLLKLRSDFERLRDLVEKVLQRENLKKEIGAARITMARAQASYKLLPEQIAARENQRMKETLSAAEKALNSGPNVLRKQARTYDASKESVITPIKKKKRIVHGKGSNLDKTQSHGVSPYDHRVFAAAAEKGYAKDAQKEPKPVDITSQVKFVKVDSPGPLRARARLGRLQRVLFDPQEQEKPVRASTYSASGGIGDAYAGGLPFEKLDDFLRAGGEVGSPEKLRRADHGTGASQLSSISDPSDSPIATAVDNWPSRKRSRRTAEADQQGNVLNEEQYTRPETMPFYQLRRRSVVLGMED